MPDVVLEFQIIEFDDNFFIRGKEMPELFCGGVLPLLWNWRHIIIYKQPLHYNEQSHGYDT